ncbi:MAG: HD domain-containing protein [Patescibacteria group bacterium]
MPRRLESDVSTMVQMAEEHFALQLASMSQTLQGLLPKHLQIMGKWADKILGMYPDANPEVVRVAVWFHDIGYVDCEDYDRDDHAVYSEVRALQFLQANGYSQGKLEQVAHCVRAHRCKDIQPETIEAKIIAVADSASHLTDYAYINLTQLGIKDYAMEKLERDYRDVGLLPEVKQELSPLYEAWKQLLPQFPDWKITDMEGM